MSITLQRGPETLDTHVILREGLDPNRTAVIWLGDDGRGEEIISYASLDRMARSVAGALQAKLSGYPGAEAPRVVLLCRPGPGFIAGFLGCLYARAIAVPAYPVDHVRHLPRLRALLEDAEPALLLADGDVAVMAASAEAREILPALVHVDVMDIAEALRADPEAWTPQELTQDDVAFLQYTSGSTGRPRGVVVTHGNLFANAALITRAMEYTQDDVVVSWLPLFHDMGLIGTCLQSLFAGCASVLMPPSAFLLRPAVWWEAVSRYRGTVTGAPNFAYALSARRVPEETIAGLDLASLRVTFNGAEPVRADTMRAFARTFAPARFNPSTFFPCYGLAEATLFASGGPCGAGVKTVAVDRDALAQGRAVIGASAEAGTTQDLVSCGVPAAGLGVRIVDTDSSASCAPGLVGEICLSGESISRGYWKKPEINARIFAGGELRTGDLGVLLDGELYVTGRIKDTIIIAGRNHYPQDIESTVEALDASVRPGCVVAYGTGGESPQVGIVAEIQRQDSAAAYEQLAQAMASAIGGNHGVPVARVTLIPTRRLSKTSSGKLQRSLTRQQVESSQLEILHDWAPAREAGECTSPPETPCVDPAGARWEREKIRVDELMGHLRWYGEHRLNSALMDERRGFAPHVILDLGNAGLMGIQVPETHGGYGLGAQALLALAQQMAALDLSLCLFWGLNNTLGIYPLLRAGTAEQQARFLPALARGRILGAFALTEPGAGSNPLAMASLAEAIAPAQWRLRGEKSWIGAGAWCGLLTTFVKEQGADGVPRGVTAFLIEQGRPGLRQGPEQMTVGMRATVQNRIFFDDIALGAEDRLGQSGAGMGIASEAMNLTRFGLGAMGLGGAKRALQLGLRYATRRTVATGRLSDHPKMEAEILEASLGLAALESFLTRCARELDGAGEGLPDVRRVPESWMIVAKVFGSEWCAMIVDRAMQWMGGRGYIESNGIAQLWRDARILRIFEGPTETLEYHLGNLMLRGHLAACRSLLQADESGAVADQFERDLTALQSRCPDAHLSRSLAGQIGVWAVLSMVLADDDARTPHAGETLAWVKGRYAVALTSAQRTLDARQEFGHLRGADLVAGYADAIGDVEQHLPGEEWSLDPMLCRDTPSAQARVDIAFAGAADRVELPRPVASNGHRTKAATAPLPNGGEESIVPTTTASRIPPRRIPPKRSGANGNPVRSGAPSPTTEPIPESPKTTPASATDVDEIQQTLMTWFARSANVPRERITPDTPLVELGLDSLTATELSVNVEERYKVILTPAVVWECTNLRAVAEYVARSK